MSTLNLHGLFNPETVTVVGASSKPGSVGAFIMKNLIDSGFKGRIIPVNPEYKEVMGFQCFPDIVSIYEKIDATQPADGGAVHSPLMNIAVIATPMATVPDVVEACGIASMAGAVIISSDTRGSKKSGNNLSATQGRDIAGEIKSLAKKYGIRILGHDSLGIMNSAKGFNAGCAHLSPLPGKIAFLCQSATVASYVLDLSVRENIGLSHFASLGSMLDIDLADMVDYLGSLHSVESILMYVENITNIRNFMSAARSVSRVKPIIVVKSGRTDALAERDSLYDAAFRRAGILRVNGFQEMFDCAQFLSRQKRPKGSRLTIITNSDGAGTMAVDALGSYNMQPSALSSHTVDQIDQFLPANWNRGNPINIPWDVAPEFYLRTAQICADSSETDALLLIYSPTTSLNPEPLSRSLCDYLKSAKCPVFTAWMGGEYSGCENSDNSTGENSEGVKGGNGYIEKIRGIFNQAGIITYDTPERGVRAFANLCQYFRNIEMLQQIPVRRDKRLLIDRNGAEAIIKNALRDKERSVLTDMEANSLMEAYGISLNRTELARSSDEAISIAAEMGYPVMLRVCSSDIPHRSPAGGATLNLHTLEEVECAFNTIMENGKNYAPHSNIPGVTVQPMVKNSDYELRMVMRQERDFGPVICFGMGGLMGDIFKDLSAALPPLDNLLARRVMEDTKIAMFFKGYRYIKPLDSELIEDMLIRLSRLVTDFPEIEELAISPIMVSNGVPVVTGVEGVVKRSATVSPMHLVISSYPFEYETEDETIEHEKIFIRPIKPSDAPLMVNHFLSLSPRSVYFRFFTPLKQLSQSMLIRLTQIDYDREIALVALIGEGEEQTMAGVARVIFEPDGKNGEFSVVLADRWHGKGIGASLLKRCLTAAAKKGLQRVWGVVLAENRQMVKLAKKLGFKMKYVSGSTEYELEIDLKGISF